MNLVWHTLPQRYYNVHVQSDISISNIQDNSSRKKVATENPKRGQSSIGGRLQDSLYTGQAYSAVDRTTNAVVTTTIWFQVDLDWTAVRRAFDRRSTAYQRSFRSQSCNLLAAFSLMDDLFI